MFVYIFLHILLHILFSILVLECRFKVSFSSEKMGRWFRGRLWILHFEVWCNTSILSSLFSSWVHWHFMDSGDWFPNVLVGKWWRCCLTFKLYLGHKGSSLCPLESDLSVKMRRKIGRKVRLTQGRLLLLLWLGFLFSDFLFLCFKKCLVVS